MDYLFLLPVLFFLIGPILGIVAFFKLRGLRAELRHLRLDMEALRARLGEEPPAPEELVEPVQVTPIEVPPEAPLPEPEPAPRGDIETRIAQRWMVWAGGVVLLGAVVLFFVYAIDQGWLSPTVRVLLGLLAGVGLVGMGEAARRKAEGDTTVNFVPAALTGAGLFALFASLFVAHAVLDLLPSGIAFALLSAVGFLGLALSLRHGWLVAALGLVAAYGTPLAIQTAGPTPVLAFFLYLFALNAAVAWLCSGRNWIWIARAAWILGFGWALVMAAGSDLGDIDRIVIGLYLVTTAMLGVLFPKGGSLSLPRFPYPIHLDGFLAGAILLILGPGSVWSASSNIALWSFGLAGLLCGARFSSGLWTAGAAAATGVLATLLWPDPLGATRGANWLALTRGDSLSATSLFFALLFGGVGYRFARRGSGPWALLSVATSFAALTALYLRFTFTQIPNADIQSWALFSSNPPWALTFLGLAALHLAAAASGIGNIPRAAYAAGVTGAAAMALAITLDGPWLTLGLAAEVTALGWIWSRTGVAALRPIAGLLAVLVLTSMTIGLFAFDDPLSAQLSLSWALRGLVIPTLLLRLAVRLFALDRAVEDARLSVIASIFLVLTALVGALTLSAGIEASGSAWLMEWKLAVMALWLLCLGGWALRTRAANTGWDAQPVGMALLTLGLFVGPVVEGMANNPFFSERSLGGWPVGNALGLVYLAPALLLLTLLSGQFRITERTRRILPWFAAPLALSYLTLETLRMVDETEVLRLESISEPALYAVSIVWIVTAFALLGLGLRRPRSAILARWASPERRKTLRLTALGLLTAAACKLFLLDMGSLSGLWRIASFVGLGGSLIGVGEIYRRVMRTPA